MDSNSDRAMCRGFWGVRFPLALCLLRGRVQGTLVMQIAAGCAVAELAEVVGTS